MYPNIDVYITKIGSHKATITIHSRYITRICHYLLKIEHLIYNKRLHLKIYTKDSRKIVNDANLCNLNFDKPVAGKYLNP